MDLLQHCGDVERDHSLRSGHCSSFNATAERTLLAERLRAKESGDRGA